MSGERLVLHYDATGTVTHAEPQAAPRRRQSQAGVREHTCGCAAVNLNLAHPPDGWPLARDFICVVCAQPIDGLAVHVSGPHGIGGQYAHRQLIGCTVRQVTGETRDHDCMCARIHPPAGFRIEMPMICVLCGLPMAAGTMVVHRHSDDVAHEQYAHRFLRQCGPQATAMPSYHALIADAIDGDTLGAVVRPEDQHLLAGFDPASGFDPVLMRRGESVPTAPPRVTRASPGLSHNDLLSYRDGRFEVQPPGELTSRGGWVAPSEALYDLVADDVDRPNAGLTELRRLARSIVNETERTDDHDLLITWDGYSITSTEADTSSVHGGIRRRQRVLHRYVNGAPGCRLTDPANGIRVSRNPEWRITVVDRSRFALLAATQLVCPCVHTRQLTNDVSWASAVRQAAMNVTYSMAPADDTLVITLRDGPHRRDEVRRPTPGPYDDAGTLLIEYGSGDDVLGIIGNMASLQVYGEAPLDRLITWEHTDRHMLHRYVNGRARCSRWSEDSDPASREPWRLLIVDQAEYVHRRNQGHVCNCLPYAAPYGGRQPMDTQAWQELVQDTAQRFRVYPIGAGVAARVMVRGHEREADPMRPLSSGRSSTATTGSSFSAFGAAARRMGESMNRFGRVANNTFAPYIAGSDEYVERQTRELAREVRRRGESRQVELEDEVETDDLPDVDEYLDVEALVAQLASPIFRWRMATGLLRGFEHDPVRIEQETPQYASARKRQMKAGDDVRLLVHAWCDAQRNQPARGHGGYESDDDG